MPGLGRHLLADLYGCGCGFDALNAPDRLLALVLEAVRASGATIMSHHVQPFSPHGVTGVVVVAESHLSFHTWPEHAFVSLDYFTCGHRVDMDAIARAAGAKIERADATWVRETTGFAIGGVAPVGHLTPPLVLLDDALWAFAEVWAAAGAPDAVFATTAEALARITGGLRVVLAAAA